MFCCWQEPAHIGTPTNPIFYSPFYPFAIPFFTQLSFFSLDDYWIGGTYANAGWHSIANQGEKSVKCKSLSCNFRFVNFVVFFVSFMSFKLNNHIFGCFDGKNIIFGDMYVKCEVVPMMVPPYSTICMKVAPFLMHKKWEILQFAIATNYFCCGCLFFIFLFCFVWGACIYSKPSCLHELRWFSYSNKRSLFKKWSAWNHLFTKHFNFYAQTHMRFLWLYAYDESL